MVGWDGMLLYAEIPLPDPCLEKGVTCHTLLYFLYCYIHIWWMICYCNFLCCEMSE